MAASPTSNWRKGLEFPRRLVSDVFGRWRKSGHIQGYHAAVNGGLLGFKETFFALVGLNSQNQAVLRGLKTMWANGRRCGNAT